MKMLSLLWVSTLLFTACHTGVDELQQKNVAPGTQTQPVITVTKISVKDLPPFDLDRTYSYHFSQADPEALLTQIFESGIPISQAWLALDDRCLNPIGTRFTIELTVPDSRILDFGFDQGEGHLQCSTELNRYTISD